MFFRLRCVAPAIVTALLLSSSVASAHDEPGRESSGKSTGQSTDGEKKEGAEGEEETEPPWEVLVDLSIGATTTEILTNGPATANPSLPRPNKFDSTRITAGSLMVGLERHIGERLTLGIRLPLIYAELDSRTGGAENRSTTAIGNLELEGAFAIIKRKNFDLTFTLEVALPTAGGNEAPSTDEVAAAPTKTFDYEKYDTFAAVHAASAARGSYESALFEPNNIGIVPKLTAHFQLGRLGVTPMVKIENLIDVRGDDEESYINELVAGVRAGYRVSKVLEPGVNLWFRELHEHSHIDDSFSGVGVVEPYARFHFGALTPAVSLVLPFAGDLVDDKTFGLRASVAGEF